MAAKDIQKLILTLFVLVIGINILSYIAKGFISRVPSSIAVPDIGGITTALSIGIIVLILILVPVYLSKRSYEKKYRSVRGEENLSSFDKKTNFRFPDILFFPQEADETIAFSLKYLFCN